MVTDSSGRNVPGQPEEEEDYEDVIDISNAALEKLYGRSSNGILTPDAGHYVLDDGIGSRVSGLGGYGFNYHRPDNGTAA
ncbi:hypothetical protein PHLCEN_2v11441 [Hermanssonia centrifuga]|uniref:Uncharacterized protein n=1 Tax=Hermanssonia centrifuga TaxID=98765 RepID=A0A2R6NK94_9APHY|nr:hypothetical protein PHLCEN_2v11441 [Hermanssonia centrifuga]